MTLAECWGPEEAPVWPPQGCLDGTDCTLENSLDESEADWRDSDDTPGLWEEDCRAGRSETRQSGDES